MLAVLLPKADIYSGWHLQHAMPCTTARPFVESKSIMSNRKRKAWTVSNKVNAVECVDKGESQAKVLHDLGISESTLHGCV